MYFKIRPLRLYNYRLMFNLIFLRADWLSCCIIASTVLWFIVHEKKTQLPSIIPINTLFCFKNSDIFDPKVAVFGKNMNWHVVLFKLLSPSVNWWRAWFPISPKNHFRESQLIILSNHVIFEHPLAIGL